MASARLLCIPQEGSPFEASGIGNYPTAFDTYNMLGIVTIDGEGLDEYDDDMREWNTPFQIHPMYKKNNSYWNSISEIIDKYYNTFPRLHTIRVYTRQNQHHFSYNKHTIGVGRRPTSPNGIICIWIEDQEYSNVSPLPKKKCVINTHVLLNYVDNPIEISKTSNLDIDIYHQEPIHIDKCRCYQCVSPNLSWTMANL